MPGITVPYAKNIIRRAFREIVDPRPHKDQLDLIWKHFQSECAYCGRSVKRGAKEAHIDHLLSSSEGGKNDLSNLVLSCAGCNESEKRDSPWEVFLKLKATPEAIYQARRERIVAWQTVNHTESIAANSDLLKKAEEMAEEVVALFETNVRRMRDIKRG